MSDEITTIQISKATRDRLQSVGKMSQTYDELLNEMMDLFSKKE